MTPGPCSWSSDSKRPGECPVSEPELSLVLASSSPRRRELLARLGLPITAVVPEVDETREFGESPVIYVQRVAGAKARAAAAAYPDRPVIAADTSVVVGDEVLGKPVDLADAARMLRRLRGRAHAVLTATAICWAAREASHLEAATVVFTSFSDDILQWYLATGEPHDKAGAYALQGKGAMLVARIEGNAQAVVGLPLARLPALFAAVGLRLRAPGNRLSLVRSTTSAACIHSSAGTPSAGT